MTTTDPFTEALAKRAGHILFTEGPEQPAATARETCVLLDLLAAAEHHATRAEAQSAIRGRAVAIHRERTREAEARIKAVRELLGPDLPSTVHAIGDYSGESVPFAVAIRRALDA